MYTLIISKDKEEIREIKKVLDNMFENQSQAREIIDEKQISLAFIKITSLKDIELAKKIIKKNPVVNIIFISETKDFAYNAFEIYASGYIVKPITEEKIRKNLEHLIKWYE